MKIIDIFNKIANGEEVPKKIKWGEFELEWEELGYHDYKFLGTGNHLLFQGFATSVLNDEVEIIEDKKIEMLDQTLNRLDINDDYYRYIMENRFKINEIIDYLEENKND